MDITPFVLMAVLTPPLDRSRCEQVRGDETSRLH